MPEFLNQKPIIMKTNEKNPWILHDLIRINNDRVAGYEKAARETEVKDADLRSFFSEKATESRRYANELGRYVNQPVDEPAGDTTLPGRIYRLWMDVKAAFSGHDRKAILASCEFGEDAAQKAYEVALSYESEFPGELRQLIKDQKNSLKRSHDRIKGMRDAQPA
jgi:uncharacterized protein (TIGR02284 family)